MLHTDDLIQIEPWEACILFKKSLMAETCCSVESFTPQQIPALPQAYGQQEAAESFGLCPHFLSVLHHTASLLTRGFPNSCRALSSSLPFAAHQETQQECYSWKEQQKVSAAFSGCSVTAAAHPAGEQGRSVPLVDTAASQAVSIAAQMIPQRGKTNK